MLSAYSCCSRVEAVWLLLSSDSGLKHFTNFVASERATDYLDLFLELNAIKARSKPTVYNMQQQMLNIVDEYINVNSHSYIILPSGLKREIESIFSPDIDNLADPVVHILEVIEKLRGEMVGIMARDQFSRFLSSKFYKNWRANERGFATASTKENSKDVIKDYISSDVLDSRKSANSAKVTTSEMFHLEKNVVPEDPTIRAFANVDNSALEHILRHASWLSALISAVEVLPISFLLCKVSRKGNNQRFPLVYANKYVEKMLGFRRKMLIGKTCDEFLRCAETEKEGTAKLEAMTQQYQATSIVLTHANARGVSFKNLIATSPVFDHNGMCDYIIYLMFNLSGNGATAGASTSGRCTSTTTVRQNSDLTAPVERYALERKKAESLLRILPDYVIPEIDDIPLPGFFESALDRLRPVRLFCNRVLPITSDAKAAAASSGSAVVAAHHHVVTAKLLADAEARRANAKQQQGRPQARVMSIREAEQSRGPDGRLGAPPRSQGMSKFLPVWS